MANSITPGGISRTIFGVSQNDIVTGGSVTAARFIGIGNDITDINANNITLGNLGISRGGTGNMSYINNAIIFNNSNRLISDNNLLWENNILTINNRDFLSDTSNYVSSETNNLQQIINNTENILTDSIDNIITNLNTKDINISNYILSTSNILIKYIITEQSNNVLSPATTTTIGGVQIGDGIYVNNKGVISLTPEIINVGVGFPYNYPELYPQPL
jgi:hypothetical protein